MGIEGHYGYKLPPGITGDFGSTVVNVIRTFVAKANIGFGQPVQLAHEGNPYHRRVDVYNPADVGIREPMLGIAVYDPTKEHGMYKTGDTVAVMTAGDITVLIKEGFNNIYPGDQVFLKPLGSPIPQDSPYFFVPYIPLTPTITDNPVGTFVDGGSSGGFGDEISFVINLDLFKRTIQPT